MHGGAIQWKSTAFAWVPVRSNGSGSVNISEYVILGYPFAPCFGNGRILLQARGDNAVIDIGPRSAISNNVSIIAMSRVSIGADCMIGDMVSIFDCDFHNIDPNSRNSNGKVAEVVIGKNVWLGSSVIVLKGVEIGDNSVVAAGSLVNKSLPSNVVAAGVPAKAIKQI